MKGNTIDEKKLVQIGNGNIVLYEHKNAEDVKAELLKLLSTISATDDLGNLNFTCLKKKEGKNSLGNIFVHHFLPMMRLG